MNAGFRAIDGFNFFFGNKNLIRTPPLEQHHKMSHPSFARTNEEYEEMKSFALEHFDMTGTRMIKGMHLILPLPIEKHEIDAVLKRIKKEDNANGHLLKKKYPHIRHRICAAAELIQDVLK